MGDPADERRQMQSQQWQQQQQPPQLPQQQQQQQQLQQQRRAAPSAAISNAAPSILDELNQFSLMEDVHERLKLLDYESKFLSQRSEFKPLSRLYFALPTKSNEQFNYFSSLFAFLSNLLSIEILDWNEFDDPATISTSILSQCKSMGLTPCDFAANRLRTGSGEAVVYILDFLTKKAIQAKGFIPQLPHYHDQFNHSNSNESNSNNDEIQFVEQDDEEEQIEKDTTDADVVEDETLNRIDSASNTPRDTNNPFSSSSFNFPSSSSPSSSTVDSTAWFLEVDRYSSQLKVKSTSLDGAREWRAHYETSKNNLENLRTIMPLVIPNLDKYSMNLNKTIERIEMKEKYLNSEYEEIGNEYREKEIELKEKQKEYEKKSNSLAEMTGTLKSKTSQLETLREQITNKNEQMSDSTPVRKVTNAVKKLKEEVNEMEVRIGLLSHSLSSVRMRKQREKTKRMGREEKERREKGNGKLGNIKQKLDEDMEL